MISLGLIAVILLYGMLGVWSTSVVADGQYGLFYKHIFSIVVGLVESIQWKQKQEGWLMHVSF